MPQALLSLVSMILEGSNAKRQLSGKPSQSALTLAQLLKFNSVKQTHKTKQCTQQLKSQETPLHRCDAACKNTEKRRVNKQKGKQNGK